MICVDVCEVAKHDCPPTVTVPEEPKFDPVNVNGTPPAQEAVEGEMDSNVGPLYEKKMDDVEDNWDATDA